jgi:hypothetical protein
MAVLPRRRNFQGGHGQLLDEIKAVTEKQTDAPPAPDAGAKTTKVPKSSVSRFGAANATALRAIQQELVAKRMEALAERLGLHLRNRTSMSAELRVAGASAC